MTPPETPETPETPESTLPLTYDECRARFRRAVAVAGLPHLERAVGAPGPSGQRLTIDATWLGPDRPRRALVVMSGTHGVEGFVGSAMQCDLIDRLDPAALPDDLAVLLVHAVNPWGMAWWRRQNESNVDLNRNWARDRVEPPSNPGYAELHPVLCPGGDEPPTAESFLGPIARYVDEHGVGWVRAAVSGGQYTHPDGLYFGGDRVEVSTRLVGEIVAERLAGVETDLTVDLHTGHGAYGEPTILSDQPLGSDGDTWLRERFGDEVVEATVDNPDATSATKVGQIGHGLADVLPGADHRSVTLEIGTYRDTRMLLHERAEHWVHQHGDRSDPAHDAIVWEHRAASTPHDPAWVASAMRHGRRVLDAALDAVVDGIADPG